MSEIDILALDQVSASEIPFEFEVKDGAGRPMGLFLSILGDDAERVHKFTLRKGNESRRDQMIRARKGKIDEYTPYEDDIAFTIDACVIRTVGWRGAKQAFTADLVRQMFARNKHIRSQVLEESANAANFTPPLPNDSSDTQNTNSD